MNTRTKKIEFPSLFNSADQYANKAQKRFIRINKWTLVILVLATIVSSLFQDLLAVWTSSILVFLAGIMSSLMLFLKFEKGWYEGRAVAESIKTLCWKFMIGAKPFDIKLTSKQAESLLIENFRDVIGHRKNFFQLIGSDFAKQHQLPDVLTQVREMDLKNRIETYKAKRLESQKKWYSDKVDENKKWRNISFTFIILAQLLALCALIFNFKYDLNVSIAPIFITISTSFIAWLQLKRYQELSQSYLITATELSLIKSKIHHIETDKDLSEFVEDSESAISREHTLWLARRDNLSLFD